MNPFETISFFSNNQIENVKISHFHQFISTTIIISLIDFFPFHIQLMSKQASNTRTEFDFPSIYIYIYISLYFIILDDLLPYVTNFIYTSLFAYSFRTRPIPCHFTSLARNEQTRFPLPLPPVHQTSLLRKTPRVTATFHYFGSRNNFGPPNNPINIISGMERDDQTLINVLIER